jgi:dihydrofolate synthase/folylpolyglutamate synthase
VPGKTVQHIHLSDRGTVFNLKLKPWIWRELRLGAIGRHQAINAGLALKAVQTVALRDGFELGEADARHTLSDLRIPARFEVRAAGKKTIIVDGAHNPQKMQSVVEAVKTLYPNRHVSTLIAMKENKDVPATLRELKSISHDYIVTSFFSKEQDFVNLSADPGTLAATISTLGGTATIVKDSHQAFTAALAQTQDILLVTGSFYFIGEIYKELPN